MTRAPDFKWNGNPVYRCRHCPYERVSKLEAVLEHERSAHGPIARPSQLVGANGEQLVVEEKE